MARQRGRYPTQDSNLYDLGQREVLVWRSHQSTWRILKVPLLSLKLECAPAECASAGA